MKGFIIFEGFYELFGVYVNMLILFYRFGWGLRVYIVNKF